ncbi:nitrogenase molybdenum-iron protein alpha chain [Desulfuromonas acetoxidans]|uniref:Nitrogenase protein alpha chain n=1 Tax=Desulfuromonas acetoxidans (strain DSM 684 / 11070) TaxID=281689 RepID=Q1K0I7_DESA6|nr:nitrogenase molybdenum-iron protein alpha chain [Desulfuromonas acetoxidans]EAT15954.1 nitrogenase molybdenum-iron protein alpha chain [Desulfuromonas acetoxidans DSM 684]MBF0644148.1 nitrogenase molybdenum-iron protein alpha chain [Desulfuromonas acetoxidans]NVD24554.1 nitrogenase molybdenum-iron protein alpha chain [Desulfuromonas acetoxidans]NVE16496.1 nitrogenase molybdenum-iron protein alpha chain [Desulfuromonas acetoxidans]
MAERKPIEGVTIEKTEKLIEDTLAFMPEKAAKKRRPHVGANEPSASPCAVKSNRKIVPGVMSQRGCAYAGAKGVVWGPIRDMVHVSHGPIGCGVYSWGTRRNLVQGIPGITSFPLDFTSDFQERDIVYGGDIKLEKLLREADELFPLNKGLSVLSECPVGLIGDDINAVTKKMEKELDKLVVPCNCEGFRGVSQSLGHHISNDSIRDFVIGKREFDEEPGPYDIALIGDYNIGGDVWAAKPILEEMGLNVKAIWTGDGEIEKIAATYQVKLNVIHCYRSMNYMCKVMEEKWNIPWIEYNFFGPTKIAESIRAIAERFDDTIKEKGEQVIAKYTPMAEEIIAQYKPRLDGKTAMLFVGGLRPRHTVGAYEDLGIQVTGTGYEFAHQDDYDRTAPEMAKGTIIYDDVSEFELERYVETMKPDLVGSGIKEKYVFQKAGIPFRQMHSWDYSGPYHGYEGFKIFARDIDMAINSPTWKLVKSPF